MEAARDAAYEFAAFAYKMTFKDIPSELRFRLKDDILDTLGNMLAGRADPLVENLLLVLNEMGGAAEASALLADRKYSAGDAAFLNASMAFALDYDDMHEPARLHFGCSAVPTMLAVAQWLGNVSGEEAITALAVALEIGARLGKHMIRRNPSQVMGGWDYAALHGCLISAIVAAKLMKLTEEQILNAMGIAFHQCAGTSISAMDNAHTKILGPGFAARSGIFAARLASAGVTGAKNLFTATEISMAFQYHNGFDEAHLTTDLGKRWDALELGFKAYPCCRLIHRHIDAAMKIAKNPAFRLEETSSIQITSCPMVAEMASPTQKNCNPHTRIAAQFSIPWTVACALVHKKVAIDEFSEQAFSDQHVLTLANKITAEIDPALTDLDDPARITVVTQDGRIFTAYTGKPLGSHENPISHDALLEKFYDCAAHSVYAFDRAAMEPIVELTEHFEDAGAPKKLIEMLFTLEQQ